MEHIIKDKTVQTLGRYMTALKDPEYKLIETLPADFNKIKAWACDPPARQDPRSECSS
jgi:hypothetical protein